MGWKINKIQRRLLGLIFILNLNNFVFAESINQNILTIKNSLKKLLWIYGSLQN